MEITLSYEEFGTGFPLVLLHGNGEDHRYFKHQIGPFSEHYRVLAVDTRGHGGSHRGEAPFTLFQFADDLRDFLREREIERCHLLGFSDGGNIALIFALKYPELVEKLVLNGANLYYEGLVDWLCQEIGEKWHRLKDNWEPAARWEWELQDLMMTQPNLEPAQLGDLTMPVLVVAGEDDVIREEHTRLIADAIPGSRLAILPGDHYVARRNPQAFNPLVLDFLNFG